LDHDTTSFIYADPVIVPSKAGYLTRWQRRIFEVLIRVSRTLAAELEIPANRRVELGVEVAI
jgi:K+ transporter